MKFKKLTALLIVATMAATALTACSTPADSTGDKASGGSGTGTAKKNITMWGSWGGDQVGQLDAQLAVYNKSQDNVNVKYAVQNGMEEKLLTAIAGGQVPDVVLWDRFATTVYAPKGAFTELNSFIEKDKVDMTQFYEPAANELTVGDKIFGIPLTVDARILFYNKAMLKEANIDPATIQTWDDLQAAAIKLTKRENGKLVQSGFSLKDVGLFSTWIKQAGGKIIDDTVTPAKASFNNEKGLEVLTYWDQLLNKDKVYDLGFEDGFGGDGFKAGKVAITYNGPWTVQSYKDAGLDFGVIEPVSGPTGEKFTGMGGFGLIIPNKAKNVDAAWDFIKWWTTNPESGIAFAKSSYNLPANKTAAADPYFTEDEILKVFSTAMLYADVRSKAPGYSDFEGLATIPQLQKFMAGEIKAEKALADAEKQGNQVLADAAEAAAKKN